MALCTCIMYNCLNASNNIILSSNFVINLICSLPPSDSIRTMNKYNDASLDKPGMTLDTKLDIRLKQCRGQRNFYITGFSLFLML